MATPLNKADALMKMAFASDEAVERVYAKLGLTGAHSINEKSQAIQDRLDALTDDSTPSGLDAEDFVRTAPAPVPTPAPAPAKKVNWPLVGGLILALLLIIACALFFMSRSTGNTNAPVNTPTPQVDVNTPTPQVDVNTPTPQVDVNTPTPQADAAPETGSEPVSFTDGMPDWTGLDSTAPSVEEVLKAHGLTTDQVIVVDSRKTSWEPALVVIEVKPEYVGKITIPLLAGYQYTADLHDDYVTTFWGGDTNVKEVTLEHGTSFRWMPTYVASENGKWAADACELVTREYRFGRYMRNADSGQPDVPYFGRVGPYVTMPGNISCDGWIVPAIDEFVPQNYLQAAAMLGGRAVESEWTNSEDNLTWSWKHSDKGSGNESTAKFYWQTVYMPQSSNGYVELWLGKGKKGPGGNEVSADGAYKFQFSDLAILLDGLHNVDEFTYHAVP